MTEFACHYRTPEHEATLVMDHDKADWTEACNAAFRHLGLEPDEAMARRVLEVLAAREQK